MLAQIGEVEAAVGIEDDIVGARQFVPIAAVIQAGHGAGGDVDPLDAAGCVIAGGIAGQQNAILFIPFKAAVVAHIQRAIRADRHAVGAAAGRGHRLLAAIGVDARDAAGADFHHQHRTIGHRHRPFRKAQPFGDDLVWIETGHVHPPQGNTAMVARLADKRNHRKWRGLQPILTQIGPSSEQGSVLRWGKKRLSVKWWGLRPATFAWRRYRRHQQPEG